MERCTIACWSWMLVASLLAACGPASAPPNEPTARGTVRGTVRFRPGRDFELARTHTEPPDTSSYPLPTATLYLLEFSPTSQKATRIVSTVSTDSAGTYELTAKTGRYYVAVHDDRGGVNVGGDLFALVGPVSLFEVVEIRANEIVQKDFVIAGLDTY